MAIKAIKPLGIKCYGSIGHLPNSRIGPGDHKITEGQARICTEKVRDKHDRVYVQEKLDGSNVGVAKIGGEIIPLVRAGYPAKSSPYEQHRLFHDWVLFSRYRFDELLEEGERVAGEWLAQAHGTRYKISVLFEPFQAFDILRGHERATFEEFTERICAMHNPFSVPKLLFMAPVLPETALAVLEQAHVFCLDPYEGVVYRVERKGKVDFLAKWVRADKVDGSYLPEVSGKEAVWNWRPTEFRSVP